MAAGKHPIRVYGGRSAEDRRAERRQRLLDAGMRLFGEAPGYRGTTITSLCEAAGLSTRQFYEEFRSLEQVLAALHGLINDRAEEAAAGALASSADLPLARRAAAAFRAYAEAVVNDPRYVRIAFVEVVAAGPELERRRMERRARWAEMITAEAERAVGLGEAAPRDYRIAAQAFVSAVNGLLTDWSAGCVDATLTEVVDELVRILLCIVGDSGGGSLLPHTRDPA